MGRGFGVGDLSGLTSRLRRASDSLDEAAVRVAGLGWPATASWIPQRLQRCTSCGRLVGHPRPTGVPLQAAGRDGCGGVAGLPGHDGIAGYPEPTGAPTVTTVGGTRAQTGPVDIVAAGSPGGPGAVDARATACSVRRFRFVNWRRCMIQWAGSHSRKSTTAPSGLGRSHPYPLMTSRVRPSGSSLSRTHQTESVYAAAAGWCALPAGRAIRTTLEEPGSVAGRRQRRRTIDYRPASTPARSPTEMARHSGWIRSSLAIPKLSN